MIASVAVECGYSKEKLYHQPNILQYFVYRIALDMIYGVKNVKEKKNI